MIDCIVSIFMYLIGLGLIVFFCLGLFFGFYCVLVDGPTRHVECYRGDILVIDTFTKDRVVHGSRNDVFRFTDIKGRHYETGLRCTFEGFKNEQ